MRSLMAMNEVGLLAAFLPEWAHIVCRWQHVMYHTYTVDVHSIFLVEELRRLWQGKYEQAVPELTELMRGCDDRAALFLGCLLHDIGKGFGGDHSEKGAERARRCVERLGLAPERVERVVFLVQHHLLMSHLAQSRDLSDPKMILEFARVARDRSQLRDLYLLTFADIRASSKKAWTDWKGQLLRELFERTSEFLETGSDDPSTALELIDERVEVRRQAAAAELQSLGVAESKVRDYFDSMPRRYFIAHTPRADRAARAGGDRLHARRRVMSTAVREMPGGSSEFILCTRDVHGLYANVAGVLTAHGINILGANVYTARSGVALEVYRLTTPAGGDEERRLLWAKFEQTLADVLSGRQRVADLLARRPRPVGPDRLASRKPATVVGIERRVGLLHDRRRHGERSAGPAARSHAHDRGPRLRDLHLEGGDRARPGDRHLLPEGRARQEALRSRGDRAAARGAARGGGAGRGRAWRRLGARSSRRRSTPSSRRPRRCAGCRRATIEAYGRDLARWLAISRAGGGRARRSDHAAST